MSRLQSGIRGFTALGLSIVSTTWLPQLEAQGDPCARSDFSGMRKALARAGQAVDAGDRGGLAAVEADVKRCMRFAVTITSTVTIEPPPQVASTRVIVGKNREETVTGRYPDVIMTATGTAEFVAVLGPGITQEAGYDFATAPEGVTAPMQWSAVKVSGGPCQHQVARSSPPTDYNFWLGLSATGTPKAGLVVGSDGEEAHDIITSDCKGAPGSGRNKMAIFSQGWIVLHGDGSDSVSGAATKPGESGKALGSSAGMAGAMAAMQKKLAGRDLASMSEAEQEQLAREMMRDPEATQAMAGMGSGSAGPADDNFMIRMTAPAVTGRAAFADYTLTNEKDLPGGQGKVTERTHITIRHLPPSP